jgi:hypothetical protein
VHTKKFPPMAGGSDGHEVVCIEAKRVCDFCFQEERIERTFNVGTGLTGNVTCMINEQNITCREVERRTVDSKKNQELACVAVQVPVTIMIGTQTITQTITFLKQAVLCAPGGTDIECQVTGNCCCFYDPATGVVTCVFNFCVVIQSKVTVRILVPTMGMCTPKRCQPVVGGCPPGAMNPCPGCNCDDSSGSCTSDC